MQPYQLRGSALLKVISIILIVKGALSLLISLLGLGSSAFLFSMIPGISEGIKTLLMSAMIIPFIVGIMHIVFGILGVVFRNKPERIFALLVFGIIMIVMVIVGIAVDFATVEIQSAFQEQMGLAVSQITGTSVDVPLQTGQAGGILTIIGYLIGFVLPGLYIYGALLNKKSLPPQ
jgi:hypothetical protein